jgi:NADH-quinone oxidoreductase subunit L
VLAILSFSAGIILFKKHMFVKDLLAAFNPIEKILANKYYVDELYQIIIVTPVKKIASFSAAIIDKLVIDGAVNGIGSQVRRIGSGLRTLQTGDLQSYALMMLMGLLVVIFLIFKVLV